MRYLGWCACIALLSHASYSPPARMLVTNELGNNVTDVDLTTNTVRKTFTVGQRPRGIVVSPDQKTAS